MSDLISRQDAIRIVDSIDTWQEGWRGNAIESLKAMPYARPTGEWEEKEVFNTDEIPIEEWQSARCSKCGKYHTTPYMYYFSNYKFCPNCGAKMEVEHETD